MRNTLRSAVVLYFCHLNFVLVSDFVLRISGFHLFKSNTLNIHRFFLDAHHPSLYTFVPVL